MTTTKDANANASVLGPEINHHGVCDGTFARVMTDVSSLFDIVTVHYYFDSAACFDIGRFMDFYVLPNSQGKPVWLTEAGYNSCYAGGENTQSSAYNTILQAFEPRRNSGWTSVFFYHLYDGQNC